MQANNCLSTGLRVGRKDLPLLRPRRTGDGMQTAALADCERLRTNRRHA